MKKHCLLLGVLAGLFIWRGEVSATTAAPAAAERARPARYATKLHYAAFDGEVKKFGKVEGKVDSMDEGYNTPLQWAVMGGSVAAVKALLAMKADVNATNRQARVPMHLAFISGIIPLTAESWEWQVHAKSVADNIQTATREDIAKILGQNGAKAVVWDAFGKTPLRYALETGGENALKWLVKAGIDLEDCGAEGEDESPLEIAAAAGNAAMVQSLLLKARLDPNTFRGARIYALRCATEAENAKCVELLLKAGAEPIYPCLPRPILLRYRGTSEEIRRMIEGAAQQFLESDKSKELGHVYEIRDEDEDYSDDGGYDDDEGSYKGTSDGDYSEDEKNTWSRRRRDDGGKW